MSLNHDRTSLPALEKSPIAASWPLVAIRIAIATIVEEQLGGFYMIDARDLNEAVRIAARIPSARTGSIEVRPVEVFE